MFLTWFDASEAKKYGESLARFYIERIPLNSVGGKKEAIKNQEVLDKMFRKIGQFRQEKKLNIYKNAQLGNAFKWTLTDAGYDPVYVNQLTKQLMFIR